MDLLIKQAKIDEIIQKTPNGDILTGNEDLFQAHVMMSQIGIENCLKEALDKVKREYNYIIIDTQPALSILTINALVASSCAVITSQAEGLNLGGVNRIYNVIKTIRNAYNKDLSVKGILLTKYKGRTRLNNDFTKLMNKNAEIIGAKVFKTTIRDSIVISESQAKRMSIFDYAPNSKVAKDYEAFVEEFLQ